MKAVPVGRTLGICSRRWFAVVLLGALVVFPRSSPAQPSGGLFTPRPSFNATNHLVSVSVFHWFTSNGGQLTGPWRPVEGRANWTGEPEFWKGQIKQMMSANIDMLYVHLIPSSEQQRINLFQALNQMRRDGYDVPKIAPFLDPLITWNQQPLVDVATTAGKDTFAGQYIRFFNQYFSVNQDPFADDYLGRIDGRVVLDTWHVKFNLSNLNSLTRSDVETRLRSAFAQNHPVFTNGIRMVTTALNDPTLTFADEKVPQFEITEYFRVAQWLTTRSVQLKGGYWDQNIRNPGDFLARNGGRDFSNAWNQVDRNIVRRVYLESWNEYDEGSGLYAANTGQPFIQPGSGNTNTDVWSSSNDPYEYIRTIARGAAAFNDTPERGARILWHNLPSRMMPGETRTATVIVRNEGDVKWTEATKFRFGQKDNIDPVLFGPGRSLINDTQDEIPVYGGIFRGRPKIFQVTLHAPMTPGVYTTHWGMVQENVTWFGDEIVQNITVDPTPILHGTPQSLDSTSLLTNRINDFSEHTYTINNLPVGSFAECPITRTFAAPIKSIKVSIVSGTADDIGYVGNILVTPDSLNTTCQLGHVANVVDVTGAVSVNQHVASLTLRARDTCCCNTGWGEDTVSGRLNARLHWEVELLPPVPISPVFSNSANGHYYVLLSPATWSFSERAAVALDGHLTSILDLAEQNWVFNTFGGFGGTNHLLWIGINDVASEGHFVWSSGEPVGFTYWAPGEPNNALTGEDFAALYPPGHPLAGQWNDWGERVIDGNGPFNGVVEIVSPNGPPVITFQPRGLKLNSGYTFLASVRATGTSPLTYQWRLNGQNIPNATNTFLIVTNVQYGQAGNYSVRVTNLLGSATSSNAVLIVNHPPTANPQTLTLDEDTVVAITLSGSDVEGDPLTYTVMTPPAHGSLTGVAPNLIYRPATNYNGSDSFTFKVNDGLIDSTAASLNINVRPVNDPPVAQPQSVSVNEDTALPITLTAFDVDGDALSYSIVARPSHGTLTGTPPNVTYLGATNYNGPDSFSFKVNDGHLDSDPATVNITVAPVNDPPVAIIRISPLFSLSTNDTNLVVFSVDGISATVIFDGSLSSDVENDPLQYFWFEEGQTNAFATGVTVTNELPLGEYSVALVVSDGQDTGTNRVSFSVISPAQAVADLVLLVEQADLGTKNDQPLLATLNAAMSAFDRDKFNAGVNQLNAFENKVRAQIAPLDPAFADILINAAQRIINSINGP
ncbi:MAG: tandem-95 repeat protein [Verrucomicrobia bacterium]|nr:tandem-95 repeat protein [Verrucomicrobiota bacterium]